MGILRDQAEAQAETEIRRKVHAYRAAKQPDGRAWISGPLFVPQWIEWAAAYLEKVVIAYTQEVLDPAAADPFERVAELERYHLERADYLFDKYFASDAESWNVRPEETRENDFPNPIDKCVFRMLISTYPTLTMYGGVAEWVEQAVNHFWEKRCALNSVDSVRDSEEGKDIPAQSTLEKSRDSRASNQIQAEFPKRAAWLKDRLAERAWNRNDLVRHSGPDRKTVDKILHGVGVREDVLDKLARALSKKCGEISILDIPSD
jgi:hypothetical protein